MVTKEFMVSNSNIYTYQMGLQEILVGHMKLDVMTTLLQESGLITDLQHMAWVHGQPLCIYGDPAFPSHVHLQAPYRNANIQQPRGVAFCI